MEEEASQHRNAPQLSVQPPNSRPPRQNPIDIDQSQYIATQDLDDDLVDQINESRELTVEELADIFCILHPSSLFAAKTVKRIAEQNPELTINANAAEAKLQQDDHSSPSTNVRCEESSLIANNENAPTDNSTPKDLVLKLSAPLKDTLQGFCFGRGPKCDYKLYDPKCFLSNSHFRIYINEHGIVMLEDTSRNGTSVDGHMLRAKEKENHRPYRRTLTNGSVIRFYMFESGKVETRGVQTEWSFIVRIPQREGEVEAEYENNLNNYFIRLNRLKNKKAKDANPSPPVLFPHVVSANGTPDQSAQLQPSISGSNASRRMRNINWKGGDKYNIVKSIGAGAFATVYMITRKNDGKAFAAKELDKRKFIKDGVLEDKVGNELRIMARIHHENVVQFIEFIDFSNHMYIIMELVRGGDLANYIQTSGVLQEDQAREMTKQLLSALDYLHDCGITHRDIKPENILLSNHSPIQAKLTDFGLSKMVKDEESFLRTFCGTLLYCAPEVYQCFENYDRNGQYKPQPSRERGPYSQSCDLWSLAAVLFYALCNEAPFNVPTKNAHYSQLLHEIMTGALDIRPLQRKGLSDACIQFLKAMLQKWPESRPSIAQLQVHAWITEAPASQGSSDEDDDVETIPGPESAEPTVLAQSTSQMSQLSVLDNEQEYERLDEINRNNLRLSMQRSFAIPDSIDSGESALGESFAFMKNGPDPGRLFGELGASALRSSGFAPGHRLNVHAPPLDTDTSTSESHTNSSSSESNLDPLFRTARGALTSVESVEHPEPQDELSLMGVDSDFGHLEMTSAAPSPQSELPLATAAAQSPEGSAHQETRATRSSVKAQSTHIRRHREVAEDMGTAEPAPKRFKSFKIDEFPVDKSEFWNTRDPGTWHDDYPKLTRGDLRVLQAQAKAEGKEKYIPPRTTSTPLYSLTGNSQDCNSPTPWVKPAKKVSRPRQADTVATSESFHTPRRILAMFIGQQESALPSIVVNITEQFTSWGRAPESTNVYPKALETRVPRHAWELVLWSPSKNTEETPVAADSQFYISSKASGGLRLNGKKCIPNYDNTDTNGNAELREWAQLKHGDIVSVYYVPGNPKENVSLRFECYSGASGHARSPNDPVVVMAEGDCRGGLQAIAFRRGKEIRAELERNRVENPDLLTTLATPLGTVEPTFKQPEDRPKTYESVANLPTAGRGAHSNGRNASVNGKDDLPSPSPAVTGAVAPLNTIQPSSASRRRNEVDGILPSTGHGDVAAKSKRPDGHQKKVNAKSSPGQSFLTSRGKGQVSSSVSEATTEHS